VLQSRKQDKKRLTGRAMNKDRALRCYNLFRRKLEEEFY
jgi:hypothetical protein